MRINFSDWGRGTQDNYCTVLWRAGYTPGDRLTSMVYSITCCTLPVYAVSCYLSDNKPVLSYLLLCLLPQYKDNCQLQDSSVNYIDISINKCRLFELFYSKAQCCRPVTDLAAAGLNVSVTSKCIAGN
jgi:hypothetical protein